MITVMIPTFNRPDFLLRLLQYYQTCCFPHPIFIGDSSDENRAATIRSAVEALKGKLQIRYFACPGLNDAQAIRFLIDRLETPYAAFVADDDFLVPDGLTAAARFLEEHPEYSAAHGKGVIAVLQEKGPYGRFAATGFYRQPVLEEATACGRVRALLQNYSVPLFSVHRAATWSRMYRRTPELKDKTFTELSAVCLSAAAGRIKQLEGLYLVRQAHDRRYFLPDSFDWVTREQWAPSYAAFQHDLVGALVEQDRISPDEAAVVVKEAFWAYLSRTLAQRYSQRRAASRPDWKKKITSTIKTVPGVSKITPLWQSMVAQLRHQEDLTLRGLLKPGSPYHKDFKIIYDIVSSQSVQEGARKP